ncbi:MULTISPECIES: MaoC/PaaZ C-terminal domain-containing protein [unclassified Herbaspirillum]|uniref:MaoC/PaaZ C-terminal domain-containing protein n=1 Tax=unclassified Herbaspirillum TaxID=2624150 RepID=UPI00114EDA1D|nr:MULTISPECIES: MaoC/PaaZ C-terminal domain-containing protein [unclassified Herbaspirillum]MBB5390285.1 acyl dehydratase [Herbaspirillum sp. SJZ102]TQK09217.1 acyl dehydratase [Herbaspirillum sp. SJZ130]TQK14096.1 acyl dehydratase [Herbaspirillum sp. SJZ106]
MAIDYHKLKNWNFPVLQHSYDADDSMLYALGIGVGAAAALPDGEGALRFVYEKNLQAMPSMAVILAHPGLWMGAPEAGVDLLKVVHGEQRLRLHRTLPSSGTVTGVSRVKAIVDKGRDKGALLIVERELRDPSGELLATVEQTSFCRGDGGFAAQGQPSDDTPPAMPAVPGREPDLVCELPTRPESALVYRLSADRNPLHADPQTARRAGFPSPILHGLATYGVACHALVRSCCGYDASRLRALATRFSAPVYPGETIRTEIWRDGTQLQFQSRAVERNQVVLANGTAEIAA